MNKETIESTLKESCRLLYQDNKHLIDEEAHERSILPQMLPYLTSHFPNHSILIEYNREGVNRDPKKDIDGNLIVPDLIVHRHGLDGENLLAIEIKGYWNKHLRQEDDIKLKGLKSKQGYKFAYRIELGKDEAEIIEI